MLDLGTSPPWVPVVLVLASTVAGWLNVVAGGGSFLTLPLLVFLGMPAAMANGTNRVGVLFQGAAASIGFHRHRVLDWRWALWASIPCGLGTLLGARWALLLPDESFKKVLALVMVAITLLTLARPKQRDLDGPGGRQRLWVALGFFGVGIYGGFIQAGVGFLVLTVTTWAGLDLVRGNAIKVLTILLSTILSLVLFAWNGKIDWTVGLLLAAGFAFGAWLGVRATVRRGQAWIRRVVTVTVILLALKLWFD